MQSSHSIQGPKNLETGNSLSPAGLAFSVALGTPTQTLGNSFVKRNTTIYIAWYEEVLNIPSTP